MLGYKSLSSNVKAPKKSNFTDAGYDIRAHITEPVVIVIGPHERRAIPTGVALEIPQGYYCRIAPRSGLAFKYGIDVLAGVVDSGYTGEVRVILINHGDEPFEVNDGDRIAQLIFTPIVDTNQVELLEVTELKSEGARGTSGFGSTGK